jgi:protein-L-isoaspartate(D-aspartate) O-methyltransferase
VPLAHGQRMLAPKIEGRILQALALDQTDDVFEVGTGSAYLTACLARLSRSVVSVDIFSDFIEAAKPKLASSGIRNVTLETADALQLRYREEFDAIAVTGSLPSLDRHFIDMLRPGGRLFVVVGRLPIMEAKFIRLQSDGSWIEESLFETVLPPLINSEHSEPFAL